MKKTLYDLLHIWYRCSHRHLLTEVVDIDGDGHKEIIVGDGPVYVLDGATGKIKRTFDLGGLCALWNCVYDPRRNHCVLADGVTKPHDEKDTGRVVGVDPGGAILWELKTPGDIFADCMHHGDLNGS